MGGFFSSQQCCYQSDDAVRLSGIAGLVELLCKSEVDETVDETADSALTITLTQVGATLVETVP